MEGLPRMDESKFRKATVEVLEGYKIHDPKGCCTKLWHAILAEMGKPRPKRKSERSNWREWSKKKVKSEDEKQAAEGPQSESELGEAAQSEMLEEIQLAPHVQKKPHDHAESMIKSEPKEEAQGAKPLLQKRTVAKLRILKGRHWD